MTKETKKKLTSEEVSAKVAKLLEENDMTVKVNQTVQIVPIKK